MTLPDERQRFIADTRDYSGPLREAARDADRFGEKNDKAALAARKMGLAAKEAADKAARAQRDAADAADRHARGELSLDEAANAAAKAVRELERADIKATEAQRAAARAAENAAQQYRQEARDAELAGAAQKLAALKAAGAVKEHNALLKDLEGRFGDLSKEGSGAFRAIETDIQAASNQLSGMGPVIAVGVANGLALLPSAAAAAGDGISLGLGGALAGIGLKAQAGTAEVKRALAGLRSDVASETRKISAPFKSTWLHFAADADNAFHQLEPSLQGVFKEMAPAVTRFEGTVINSLDSPRVQAAITSIGHSFSAVLDALGPATGSAIGDVADGIKSISDAAAKNPQALAGLVSGIGQITKLTGEGIGALIRYKDQIEALVMVGTGGGPLGLFKFVSSLKDGTQALLGTSHGLQTAERTFPTFSQQATAAAAATGHLMTANQAAALSADRLKTAMDNLTGKTLTERESMIQYRQAITQMTQALKDNGHAHGFATAKGAANEQALDGMAVAAQKAAQAMKDDGKSAKDVSAFLEGARQRIIATAEKMHYSASEAKALADQLLGVTHAANTIPSSKNTKLSNNAKAEIADLRAYQRWVNSLHGKTVQIHTVYTSSGSTTFGPGNRKLGNWRGGLIRRAEGGPVAFGDGGPSGMVVGPGTGTSDSIPALLSNGEYVINAKQTAKWLPLLEQINAGVEGFAKGGKSHHKFKPKSTGHKLSPGAVADAQARVAHARSRPEYLAAMAAQQALEAMRRSVYGGFFRGGPSTLGSAHGSVVQHVTNVNVTVQGNVWQTTQLAQELQSVFLRSGMPLTLPAGR